jgi:hypothetical protein
MNTVGFSYGSYGTALQANRFGIRQSDRKAILEGDQIPNGTARKVLLELGFKPTGGTALTKGPNTFSIGSQGFLSAGLVPKIQAIVAAAAK